MAVLTAFAPAELSDDQLLERFARGDRSALEKLFVRYRGLAYRVAHRLLNNEADALDAVQEAFVKVLTRLHGFEGRSSFKTWLLRVVSTAALDGGRQRRRRETRSLEAVDSYQRDHSEPAAMDDPALGLYREDLRAALNQALSQLSKAQRQTFVLHAEAELSYREVADVLGISMGTVMSRLYYARQKLRIFLEPWIKQ
jgi:RNA polymerase sigma-70 factor (ECF subfamily)